MLKFEMCTPQMFLFWLLSRESGMSFINFLKYKTIETYARAFFMVIIFFIGGVSKDSLAD